MVNYVKNFMEVEESQKYNIEIENAKNFQLIYRINMEGIEEKNEKRI